MVLNINIYTHLEIWLLWKTEWIKTGTILANNTGYNHRQYYLLGTLVICVHRLLNNLVWLFSPKPTVPSINTCLSCLLKCAERW